MVEHRRIMLSKAESQEILGVGRNAMKELIHREDHPIPTVRVGKRFLIPKDALHQWIEEETCKVKT